jgi:hypothetical protein
MIAIEISVQSRSSSRDTERDSKFITIDGLNLFIDDEPVSIGAEFMYLDTELVTIDSQPIFF